MKVRPDLLTLLSTATILSYLDVVWGGEDEATAEECKALGFARENVLCSSCAVLPEFDLKILKDNCERCCSGDKAGGDGTQDKTVKRYPKARLEVCG